MTWTPNPDRPSSPLTASGQCLDPSGQHSRPVDGRCTVCGAVWSEDVNHEMIERGLSLSTEALAALHDAHLIEGFAVVVSLGDEKFAAAACCPAHMAELVDMEIASGSDDPRVQRSVQLRSIDALTRLLGGAAESPYAAFREPFPAPRDVPDAGPAERAQEASDDVRESDAGTLDRYYRMMQNQYPDDDADGTGMYL